LSLINRSTVPANLVPVSSRKQPPAVSRQPMLAADCWLLTAVPSWERSRLLEFPHARLAVCLTSVGGEGETEPGSHSADVDYESRKVSCGRTHWLGVVSPRRAARRKPPGFSPATRNMTVLVHSRPCSGGGPTLRSSPRQRRRFEDMDHGLGRRPRTADTSRASGGHMFPCPTDQLPLS
jgi:hypothetical protein